MSSSIDPAITTTHHLWLQRVHGGGNGNGDRTAALEKDSGIASTWTTASRHSICQRETRGPSSCALLSCRLLSSVTNTRIVGPSHWGGLL